MSTLAELFATDPRHLSDADLDQIIARYREARAQYNLGARAPGSKRTMEKKDKVTAVDLKALGLLDDI